MKIGSKRLKWAVMSLALLLGAQSTKAQQLLGTEGMMNIPTADMKPSGTFVGGMSYVERSTLCSRYNYNTGLYYIDFTPFSWMEITFRETLLKTTKRMGDGSTRKGFYQQDRSTTIRLAPLKEKEGKWVPSVVLGCNDIYSDHGNSYYTSAYAVVTKHFNCGNVGKIGGTLGYAKPFKAGVVYDGAFAGIEFSPKFYDKMRVMAEYDTQGYNVGISALLFKHMNVMLMSREFGNVCGALSYQYTIKY